MAGEQSVADLLSLAGKFAGGSGGKTSTQVQSTSSNTVALTFNPSINVQSPGSPPDLRTYQSPTVSEPVSMTETDGSGRQATTGTLKIPTTGTVDTPESSSASIFGGSNMMLFLIIGVAAFLLFGMGNKKGKGA
jgi:hypothetical protein